MFLCNATYISHACQLTLIKLTSDIVTDVILTSQERDVKFFTETEENQAMMAPRAGVPYFL